MENRIVTMWLWIREQEVGGSNLLSPTTFAPSAQIPDFFYNTYGQEDEMKAVKISKVFKEPYIHPLFTETDVTRQFLVHDRRDFP